VSDIANAIYKHLRTMAPHQLERLTAIQLREAAEEIERLRSARADAIRRPMGVVPDSAKGLVTQDDLDAAEYRRTH
jgi:C4-dicarboxylate-specific signal transduction histidine kinase